MITQKSRKEKGKCFKFTCFESKQRNSFPSSLHEMILKSFSSYVNCEESIPSWKICIYFKVLQFSLCIQKHMSGEFTVPSHYACKDRVWKIVSLHSVWSNISLQRSNNPQVAPINCIRQDVSHFLKACVCICSNYIPFIWEPEDVSQQSPTQTEQQTWYCAQPFA